MDNLPENNFFELSLSQQGASWLLRLHKVVRWLIIFFILLSLVVLLEFAIKYRTYLRYKGDSWLFIIQTRIYPVVEIIVLIIAVIQNYYFLHFTRACKKSIEMQQADLFNESFKWLYKMAVLIAIMNMIQFMMLGIAAYGDLVLS